MALTNPKKMFEQAKKAGTGICAFNFINQEIMRSILTAADRLNTPVIIQTSEGAIKYYGLKNIVDSARNMAGEVSIDFALHLDHGTTFESCKACVDAGYTSVMIDASHHNFAENIALTKQVADYAKAKNVFVEAELGRLAGVEDNIQSAQSLFTDPREANEFVVATKIDSLAVSVGTSHGAYKNAAANGLRSDIIKEISKANPALFLVLHGASTIDAGTVSQINDLGGAIKSACGNSPAELKKAIKAGVQKINIDSDLRLAYNLGLRKFLKENPAEIDIRKINTAACKEIEKTVASKIELISK